ncbi:MAG: winged helix-turn-helix domain-containing protein [Chloroflexi bacterium]|nr:winged helix-turn-helix domain-containing protein [Chloroflexota bacterium]
MPSRNEYIEELNWRLESLRGEISKLQGSIQELFDEVKIKQEQAKHLMMLLESEGQSTQDPELSSISNKPIADIAFDFVSAQQTRAPYHYVDLANELMSKGIYISGKNPSANLLAHMSRDSRFVRIAPGTYGLADWGLEPVESATKSKVKRKRRKKK